MEQTLHDYIRQDAKLRQFLLNQDGGIMKFWAEHPDKPKMQDSFSPASFLSSILLFFQRITHVSDYSCYFCIL